MQLITSSKMALPLVASLPKLILPRLPYATPVSLKLSSNARLPCQTRSMKTNQVVADQTSIRRSGNWTPPISDHEFLRSLTSEYAGEAYVERANKLIADVRIMLQKALNHCDQLELIDILERIGLAYHFEDDIRSILDKIFNDICRENKPVEEDLYATALGFRLLRKNGFVLPQEVFNRFRDETGNFKESLGDDIKGMLNLYEASYLLMEGENILEDARDFAAKHLKEYEKQISKDQYLSILVVHALELPLHWRMPRMEARWFVDVYERKKDYDPIILELARLDFNMVQAKHQDDIRDLSRWWNDLDIGKRLPYTRERIIENVFFAVGEQWEPRFGYFRKRASRVNALITSLDDAYDVYCTLEEAELLTEAVDGWDMNAMERLPPFLKILYLVLFNTTDEIAYFVMKETGINVVPAMKKMWGDLCRAGLQEAKWFYSGYTPSLKEYLENGRLSIAIHVISGLALLLVSNPLTPEIIESYMESEYPNIVRFSSIIFRLTNDLGTSSDEIARGDVPKSIQCYMHETGASEEEAREHIRFLISETWKKLNKERYMAKPFSQTLMEITLNLARTGHCCYEHGDGYGIQDSETKDMLFSLFVHPLK